MSTRRARTGAPRAPMPDDDPLSNEAGLTIIGVGPAALACALWRARHERVFVTPPLKAASQADASWIEAVPMKSIAELVELGVHPHDLGVREFVRTRAIAWRSPEPEIIDTAPAAHLERPALERALLALAMRNRRIEFLPRRAPAWPAEQDSTHRRRESRIVDASGRRAVAATHVYRCRRPWVARTFAIDCDARRAIAPLMVAALPHGYLYRAAGAHFTTIGIVGRGHMLAGSGAEVCERLLNGAARWAVADLATRTWHCTGSRPASMQWAEFGNAVAIGDAAFARDALSSQGLASSLTDARYAALIETDDDCRTLAMRSRLARDTHAASLLRMLREVWCTSEHWRQYQAELGSLRVAVPSAPTQSAERMIRKSVGREATPGTPI
ncbi:hypothetical protein [Paraburkholderia nodosa]|uniref:hypothetical protein n=1 Tax=Paraburkholderia nodosa TaxID=392320 RepID=UPI00114D2389|nr:hypothetical protein [Paraburkholderia nodosa]